MFQPGLRQCITSSSIASRFQDCGLGQTFRSGRHAWRVVGLFDARQTAFDSEIWMDADEAREAFRRAFHSSLTLPAAEAAALPGLSRRIEGERLMRLRALTEAN
jgi:Ser/Thr protein kinase RdoA (MazF antagonist)